MPNISKYALLPFGLLIDSDEINWPLLAPDGSIGAPSYSFASAPGKGLYINPSGSLELADFASLTKYGFIRAGAGTWSMSGGSTDLTGHSILLAGTTDTNTIYFRVQTSTNNNVDATLTPTGLAITKTGTGVADLYTHGFLVDRAAKTTTYVVKAGDSLISADATAGAFTVTLPAAASHTGRVIYVKKIDSSANAVTIDGNASEEIDGETTLDLVIEGDCAMLICTGAGWEIV